MMRSGCLPLFAQKAREEWGTLCVVVQPEKWSTCQLEYNHRHFREETTPCSRDGL
jgi:hypothetical protein